MKWLKLDGETEVETNDEDSTIEAAINAGWTRPDEEPVAPTEGTVDWYKVELGVLGIEFKAKAKLSELKELYDATLEPAK